MKFYNINPCFIRITSLDDNLSINEINIKYSCALSQESFDLLGSIPLIYNEATDTYKVVKTDAANYNKIQSVVIPSYFDDNEHGKKNVTIIDKNAFDSFASLTSIDIPSTVTSIGNRSFSGCSKLKEVYLPSFLTKIDDYAFYKCSFLEEINIPDSVTSIGENIFTACYKLKSVNCPKGVNSLSSSMFYQCSALEEFVITSNIKSINSGAFKECKNLSNLSFEGTVNTFSKMSKGYNWSYKCDNLKVVHCSDGDFSL